MDFLIVTLYSLLIVLVIVLIILGLKAINTLSKVDVILDNTKEKLDNLDAAFNLVGGISSKVSEITDTIVSNILGFITNIFKNKKEEKIDE